MKKNVNIRLLAEGGIAIALAIALSYLKIPIGTSFGGYGGSVDLVMVPLIIFAMRAGFGWGFGAGLIFGTLKYFFANGFAVSWVSIIFDYSVAYAAVGVAGLLRKNYNLLPLAAFLGCLARFVVHFISGITVYAEYLPDSFMGVDAPPLWLYSLLYNGSYMLFNTILAVVICGLLVFPAQKLKSPKS